MLVGPESGECVGLALEQEHNPEARMVIHKQHPVLEALVRLLQHRALQIRVYKDAARTRMRCRWRERIGVHFAC